MKKIYKKFIKRLFDFVFSFLLLILLLPLLCLISIIIKLSSNGSILFIQERVGLHGKIFKLYKFRTMTEDKQAVEEFDSSKDYLRLTKIGAVLRRFKIDELPQLINIFIGDMSFVGPRPTVVRAFKEHDLSSSRTLVKPGLTGLAQINGNVLLSWKEREEYDEEYIKNEGFYFDIKILYKTLFVILKGEKRSD